jgi:ribosomal-protein-alanine acetyltransferase
MRSEVQQTRDPEIRLETFLSHHVSEVMALEQNCGLEVWRSQDYVNMLIGDPGFHGLIALAEGRLDGRGDFAAGGPKIVGFIAGRIFPPDVEIYKLAVDQRHQRQGIGSLMMHRFLEMAGVRGAFKCFLEVRESNSGAIHFYHSHGFVNHGRRQWYYKDPAEHALVMMRHGENL